MPQVVGGEGDAALTPAPLPPVPLSAISMSVPLPLPLPLPSRWEAAVTVMASGAAWALLPLLPLVADGKDSASAILALFPPRLPPALTASLAASPTPPSRLAVGPMNIKLMNTV